MLLQLSMFIKKSNSQFDETHIKCIVHVYNKVNVWLSCTFPFTIRDNMLGIWMGKNIQIAKTHPANYNEQQV